VFASSEPFLLFDYFRVPYERRTAETWVETRLHRLQAHGTGRNLYYPGWELTGGRASTTWFLGSIRFYAGVASDETMHEVLRDCPGRWSPAELLTAVNGDKAALWRSEVGDVALPFDPNHAIRSYWSEAYQHKEFVRLRQVAQTLTRTAYYRIRPILARRLQIMLRRGFSRIQRRSAFPAWPVENSLQELYDWIL